MISLSRNQLVFSFPEVHKDATLRVDFQRTFRIPDDGQEYPLPPGFGRFPVHHVDDYKANVPDSWMQHGGAMLPMYQSEAMWISFHGDYPCAVKIAAGKINAVTGEEWTNPIHGVPQDYLVTPEQPWLDGFCVKKGVIRQFIAMPLGSGYTAEEQLTGSAEHGGLQILVHPMKAEEYKERFERREQVVESMLSSVCCAEFDAAGSMGLAPGGTMRQEIYDDPFGYEVWDKEVRSRCFVHIANSLMWRAVTNIEPPMPPLTAVEYEKAGLPWFDYYNNDAEALEGSDALRKLKSVIAMGKEKGEVPVPENASVIPGTVMDLGRDERPKHVREGTF